MKQSAVVSIMMILFVLSSPVFAKYSGGSGTEADPYQIADVNDWNTLMATSADWSKYFILTSDINLSSLSLTPIGNSSINFTGIFDGKGYIIRNIYINLPSRDYIGLFGYVGNSGQIKNLGIEDANITGSYTVGVLVGSNAYGLISNCYSTGIVRGKEGVGGLVGGNSGSLTNCYSTVSVYGTMDGVGGLAGSSSNTHSRGLTNCYATGPVNGEDDVGGLVGWNYSSIANCYATGSVHGRDYVGGLVGDSYGTYRSLSQLTNCYATGTVNGTGDYVGGLIGVNSTSVTNCYSTGSISGTTYVGGFTGYNYDRYSILTNCYATGFVSGTIYVGGLAGENTGSIISSFWNTETSGQSTSAGGTGKTTAEMKLRSTFTDAGWDFINETANGYADYWCMSLQFGYPVLNMNLYSGGSGIEPDPWQIADANDWKQLMDASCHWGNFFILMEDIDLKGMNLTPVGNKSRGFNGAFDGNGHIIHNADMNLPSTNHVGLFGYVDTLGQIKNLGIEDVNIAGNYYVGGLLGYSNYGTIINCFAKGRVTGVCNTINRIGGLVGWNNFGTINNCYANGVFTSGNVSGDVGGLIGLTYEGTIKNCYASGKVTGKNNLYNLGGLLGSNLGGTVINSYTTVDIRSENNPGYSGGFLGWYTKGMINNCFWDTQTSGTTIGVGYNINGIFNNLLGKTTIEMQTESTFANYGWDFNTPVWVMWDGHEYPWLAWEKAPVMAVDINIVDKERVGRTVFRYLCKLTLRNTRSQNFSNVSAKLAEVPNNVTVIDGAAGCSFIGAHSSAISNDTFEIEIDRSVLINPVKMVWKITYELAGIGQQQEYMNSLDFVPTADTLDLTGDGVTNMDDLFIFASQWLQPGSGQSADIAPASADGIVNFLDFAVMAEHWLEGT